MISREQFIELPLEAVAEQVRAGNLKTCVFPFNGTRRWFLLEHGHKQHPDMLRSYNDLTGMRYIEMFQMLFDHGIETVLAPVFGGDIMDRGDEYMEAIGSAMTRLADHPDFRSFYDEYSVRVRFYGEFRKKFQQGPYAYICDRFDQVGFDTAHYNKHRLLYGVFASDATESVSDISVKFHQLYQRLPTRKEIIERYYGDYIEKADLFIGFEKFTIFDYPLLSTGDESLYFTAAPSLFMTIAQLRCILYDYLYLRTIPEPDYYSMSGEEFKSMKEFYEVHRETTYGTGEVRGGIWYIKP